MSDEVKLGRDITQQSFIAKHSIKLFCLAVSFCFLLFTSKCSFLYPLNDWMDANAFFTMGKGMMKGVVPYRDLFEQKGPLLYLIYGLGYIISNKTFYGVFVFEVLFFTAYLYYSYKCFELFVDKRLRLVLVPLLAFLTTTCVGFVHGGSAEEFCFPFYAYTMYSFLRYFKKEDSCAKNFIINGVLAGCVLLIKYTLLGFWFGFMSFIFFDLILKKKVKQAFMSCVWFLLGMFAPILIGIVYLMINSAMDDFIDCYFKINLNAYNREKTGLLEKVCVIYAGFFGELWTNGRIMFAVVILSPFTVGSIKIRKQAKFGILWIFLTSVFLMFFGLRFYKYYILPAVIFTVPSLIGLGCLISGLWGRLREVKFKGVLPLVYSLSFVGFLLLSIFNANYSEMILWGKEDMFQFEYADYINGFENPTLLNMGYLDAGLYTTTGIVPNTRFFEKQNIPYDKFPENLDEMRKYVDNKEVMFVLYYTKNDYEKICDSEKELMKNYELVKSQKQKSENTIYNVFLFKVKE